MNTNNNASRVHAEPIIWEIIEEHLDEAAFLLEMHQVATISPDYNLKDLSDTIEQRLIAHIDGLRTGGDAVAQRVLHPALLDAEDLFITTVAALTLLSNGNPKDRGLVFEAINLTEGAQQQSLALAMSLSSAHDLDTELLFQFNNQNNIENACVWLEILTQRGIDPGDKLNDCFQSSDARLIHASLMVSGVVCLNEYTLQIESHLNSPNTGIALASIEAGLAIGSKSAWKKCLEYVQIQSENQHKYMLYAAIFGGIDIHERLHELLENEETREDSLWALSYSGSVQSAQLCKHYLKDENERVVKMATQVLASVGGFDFMDDEFVINEVEGHNEIDAEENEFDDAFPSLDDDDLDADLVPDFVEDLPTPNVSAIETWWNKNCYRFSLSKRYIHGKEFTAKNVTALLETIPMFRRHGYIKELTMKTNRFVQPMAFVPRQLCQLKKLESLNDKELLNKYCAFGWF